MAKNVMHLGHLCKGAPGSPHTAAATSFVDQSEACVDGTCVDGTRDTRNKQLQRTATAACDDPKAATAACDDPKAGTAACDDPKAATAACDDPKAATAACDDPKAATAACGDPKAATATCDDPKALPDGEPAPGAGRWQVVGGAWQVLPAPRGGE